MVDSKFIRPLIALGVPGVALGIFYLLYNRFDFKLSQIDATWTVVVIITFMLVTAGVTVFALHRWAPQRDHADGATESTAADKSGGSIITLKEEVVTYSELLLSRTQDVVKINAHSHHLGVMAEYKWIKSKYPEATVLQQSLTSLDLTKGSPNHVGSKVFLDVIEIALPVDRKKSIYFDITSFFDGDTSSTIDPDAFAMRKIRELYKGH